MQEAVDFLNGLTRAGNLHDRSNERRICAHKIGPASDDEQLAPKIVALDDRFDTSIFRSGDDPGFNRSADTKRRVLGEGGFLDVHRMTHAITLATSTGREDLFTPPKTLQYAVVCLL